MRKLVRMFFLFPVCAAAQDAVLTKGETISYIQKKLNEGIKHRLGDYTVEANSVSISDCEVAYKRETNSGSKPSESYPSYSPSYTEYYSTWSFNPMHIKSISESSSSSGTLKYLSIKLIGKTGKKTYYNKDYQPQTNKKWVYDYRYQGGGYYNYTTYYQFTTGSSTTVAVDEITIYFLGSDPSNFNKFRKAFEHLRDLCKAEDDPFGD